MRFIKFIVILTLLLYGCNVQERMAGSANNFASLYNPSEFSINADYKVYNRSDNLSDLYFRIYPGEFLFNQANDENEYRALVKLEYSLYKLNERGQMIAKVDSASHEIKLGKKEKERSAYFSSLVLKAPKGNKYLLKLKVTDLQRGTMGLSHVIVDKISEYSAQNFSVVTVGSAIPKFMDHQHLGEVFSIHFNKPGIDTIYLTFFKYEYELPRPPVRRIDIKSFPQVAERTIKLPFADSVIYTLPGKGMYHFRIDTTREEGLTLFNFGDNFPKIKTEREMIESLFYIAYPVEYKGLVESDGNKVELDNFWLRREENVDRSRELIRIYYNRVLYSNIYFTADREGWKTDRGLIYILFGPPDRMQDLGTSQIWYYVSRRSQVVSFKFHRGDDIYTNDGFYLEKDQFTMRYLNEAISSWNRGKVHSLKN